MAMEWNKTIDRLKFLKVTKLNVNIFAQGDVDDDCILFMSSRLKLWKIYSLHY